MPDYHIRQQTGGAPEDFFSTVGFSGDHSQTLRLVASGAYDIGALNYAVYDKAVADGAPEVETAKVIWKTTNTSRPTRNATAGTTTASAIAWVLFAIIMVLTALAFWSSKYWVYYAGDKRN